MIARQAAVSPEGVATFTLTSTGAAKGSLSLSHTAKRKGAKKPKPTVLGSAAVSLTGSGRATVTVHLNRSGKALLKAGGGKLSVVVTVTIAGAAQPTSATVALRQSVKHRVAKGA